MFMFTNNDVHGIVIAAYGFKLHVVQFLFVIRSDKCCN